MEKQIADQRRGSAPTLWWFGGAALFILALASCARKPDPAGDVREVPRTAARAARPEPRFIEGGAPGDIAISCGSSVYRIETAPGGIVHRPLPAHDYLALWFDPSGSSERSVVASDEGPLLLDGERTTTLPGWPGGVAAAAVAFSSDGSMLAGAPASGGGDYSGPALIVWRFPLRSEMVVASEDLGSVTHMVWSADGKTLLVVDSNNRISIFQPLKAKPVFTQEVDPGSEGRITAVNLSADGDWYLMAANAIRLRAWRLPFMNTQLTAWGTVRHLFFAGNVNEVVTIDETDTAIHWFVNSGNVMADTSEALGDVVTVGVPIGGDIYYGLDASGVVRGWRSGTLQPFGEVATRLCEPVAVRRDTTGAGARRVGADDSLAAPGPSTGGGGAPE